MNEVFEGSGGILFAHACKLGCEGVVSKRLGSPYRSGRSPEARRSAANIAKLPQLLRKQ